MSGQRAGRAMFNAMLETLRLSTMPMCPKCYMRSRMKEVQERMEELRELIDRLNLPPVLHGTDETGAGYALTQMHSFRQLRYMDKQARKR